jgi:hypothetical protein
MTLTRFSILFLLAALLLAGMAITLTDHAAKKTDVGLGMSVAAIESFIRQQKCSPITIYTCPYVVKYVCPAKPGWSGLDDLHMGIIVGHANGPEVVITGWIAPLRTWDKLGLRDGCTKSNLFVPLP